MKAGRPRGPAVSKIGELIDAYLDQGHELKNLASDVGVSTRTVLAWRTLQDIPKSERHATLARELGQPVAVIEQACALDRDRKGAGESTGPGGQSSRDLLRHNKPAERRTSSAAGGNEKSSRETFNYRLTNLVDPEVIAENAVLNGNAIPEILFPKIYSLGFGHSLLRDLSPLAKLTHLKRLDLFGTYITDLSPLQHLRSLEYLNLAKTRIRDLRPLMELTNLKHLDLEKTLVDDISPLIGMTSLEWLDLDSTLIRDFLPLSKLVNLRRLDIKRTDITDLLPLASLGNLETIDLRSTEVADITPLISLVNLKRLYLNDTQVPEVSILSHLKHLRLDW